MKQISILGCGWLGFPLAKSLIEKGFSINGSTTSLDKIAVLNDNEIQGFQIEIGESQIKGEISSFLENSKILIIDIPPKLRGASSENFVQKIQNLIPFIEKSSLEKVLFVSSTAVYADLPLDCARGDKNLIDDNTIPNPETESGKQLLEAETLLQSNKNFQTTILRFGGLIGENRHPIHFLAGQQNLENQDAPINLIHQTDCIGIIEEILRQAQNDNWEWNEIFNAAAPFHPTRKEYYTQKAIKLHLPLPEFNDGKVSIGKTIISDKLETMLHYKFQNTTL